MRNGHKNGDIFKGDEGLSKPNIQQGTPYIWMTAAEVFFLRAEGALKQWDMKGTPEALYKSGIRASFEQHGVKNVENYLVSMRQISDAVYYLPSFTIPKVRIPGQV